MAVTVHVSDDFPHQALQIMWRIENDHGLSYSNGSEIAVPSEPHAALELEPLRLSHEFARALLDALTRFYDGAEDTRALRRDYEHEKARVDKMLDALLAR